MQQGYSGSSVAQKGSLVEKVSSDQAFIESKVRQKDLVVLSRKVAVLPRIERIEDSSIFMEYIDGKEGLTLQNAPRAGEALRLLHEQGGYPHPCMTGVEWLVDMANQNLGEMGHSLRISSVIADEYPNDVLIHSEPVQLIEKKNDQIIFIDFEGIGMGSRYLDLGFVFWRAIKENQPELYLAFLQGYQADTLQIEPRRVQRMAGVISLAYVGFALAYASREEAEERLELGLRLWREGE